MVSLTIRLSKVGIITTVLVCILAAATIWGASKGVFGAVGAEAESPTVQTGKDSSEKAEKKSLSAKSNEERLSFMRAYGWEIEEEAAEIAEVLIPGEFDDVYLKYNDIQKKQGFDLLKYAGKRCKRYSYSVTNYPGYEEMVRLNVLVYKDKVIGGDVCTQALDGFIHGFELP